MPGKGSIAAHNFSSWDLFWPEDSNLNSALPLTPWHYCLFTYCHPWLPIHLMHEANTIPAPQWLCVIHINNTGISHPLWLILFRVQFCFLKPTYSGALSASKSLSSPLSDPNKTSQGYLSEHRQHIMLADSPPYFSHREIWYWGKLSRLLNWEW